MHTCTKNASNVIWTVYVITQTGKSAFGIISTTLTEKHLFKQLWGPLVSILMLFKLQEEPRIQLIRKIQVLLQCQYTWGKYNNLLSSEVVDTIIKYKFNIFNKGSSLDIKEMNYPVNSTMIKEKHNLKKKKHKWWITSSSSEKIHLERWVELWKSTIVYPRKISKIKIKGNLSKLMGFWRFRVCILLSIQRRILGTL